MFTLPVEEQESSSVFCERKQVWKTVVDKRQAERERQVERRQRHRQCCFYIYIYIIINLFHHMPVIY